MTTQLTTLSVESQRLIRKFVDEHFYSDINMDFLGLQTALILLLPHEGAGAVRTFVYDVLCASQPALFNLTAHEITLVRDGKKPVVFPPCGPQARVSVTRTPKDRFIVGWDNTDYDDNPDGELMPVYAEVFTTEYGRVEGLPASSTQRFYIVSRLVIEAVKRSGRMEDDLLVPDDLVRDEAGRIIGCRSFATT